jgi:hypothetical protein
MTSKLANPGYNRCSSGTSSESALVLVPTKSLETAGWSARLLTSCSRLASALARALLAR